jgi:hypothetical protein
MRPNKLRELLRARKMSVGLAEGETMRKILEGR